MKLKLNKYFWTNHGIISQMNRFGIEQNGQFAIGMVKIYIKKSNETQNG